LQEYQRFVIVSALIEQFWCKFMFSLVQNISSALKPLKSEATDARFEKKRDSLNKSDKNTHNKHFDGELFNDEEFTTISVKALILFLEDFLETRLDSNMHHEKIAPKPTLSPWLKYEQSNDMPPPAMPPKEASNAYIHAAKASRGSVKKIEAATSPELKNIYSLINDLRQLQDCGVKSLNVNSEKALINGIITAVKNAKTARNSHHS